METNNWNNRRDNRDYRDRDYRDYNYRDNNGVYNNSYRTNDRNLDDDAFRGAYRFETEGNDHDRTTYNGFERRREDGRHFNRYSRLTYEQDRDRDHQDSNQGYRQDWSNSYRSNRNDRDYDYNFGDNKRNYFQGGNERHYDEQYRPTSGGYGTRFGGDRNNFDADYSPDRYRGNRDENYGNTAGSLSWGYDGINNYDPDYNRNYDPLTGRQSYYGENSNRRFNRDNDYGDRY